MSYTITVQVYQTNQNAFFNVVEKTVFRNGTWDEVKGAHVLTMGSSGTCGSLRFVADTSENFIVTLGVHNYKPWGDIVTKLDPASQTGVVITPEYYEKEWGGTQVQERVDVRWKTLSSYEVTRDGRKFSFSYTVTGGNNLNVNVVIG
ncbi:fungal fruit body lectin [Lasiosphaeria hispida]|uniref:Fungal fruit body lectin n=1 Tax=Lasiosphaeria hispida TaxID=260671 RepID=A0AAJ0H7R9_9PEZI|nr:fungal fruit body lectin [Lasiosphaeria hispida]